MARSDNAFTRLVRRFAIGDSAISVKPEGIPTKESYSREIGASGTQDYHGFITQDFNAKFNGDSAVRIYDEMRKTDGTVAGVIRALKLPIQGAERMIESPDTDDSKQEEITEFVRQNLFEELEGGFDQFLQEALNYFVFGFYYFEKVYEIKGAEVRLKKLAPRLPSAHYRWAMQNDKNTPGITQLLPAVPDADSNKSSMREIPMWKLVLFTNEKEGDNYEGVSILRSAYKHWYFKDTLYRIDGIKHERGAGVLTIGLPTGSGDDDRARAEELGENFKVNEQAYIVKPSPDWTVELLTAGIADQSAALMESVKHHDRMIMTNILAQFLDLGAGATGSYSLSKDQSSFFGLAVKAIGEYVSNVINEQIIKELVTLNYGEQEAYPRFTFPSIGEIDFTEMADVIQKLTAAGVVKNDPQFKVYVHKMFGLPEVTVDDFDDEETQEPKDPNAPPTPPNKADEDEPEDEKKDQGDGDGERELAEKKYFRPLTLAEERVKFAEVEGLFDDEEGELEQALNEQTEKMRADLLKKLEAIIDADDVAAINALNLVGLGTLAATVAAAAKRALDAGKRTAANELGATIPVTTNYTKRVLETKIALYLNSRNGAIETAVKERLVDLLNNDIGKAAAMFELQKIIDNTAAQQNNKLVGKVVVDFFDEGRALSFEDMREQLYGLQRSEILDDATCPMCMTIDGRVLDAADPFTKIGQIHTNCRGIWVGVLKTDGTLPRITAIPKSVKNKFQTTEGVPSTNNFQQLNKPIVRKGSRLEQKIADGDIEV